MPLLLWLKSAAGKQNTTNRPADCVLSPQMDSAKQDILALLAEPALNAPRMTQILNQLVQEQVGSVAARQILSDLLSLHVDGLQPPSKRAEFLALFLERLKSRAVSFEEQVLLSFLMSYQVDYGVL